MQHHEPTIKLTVLDRPKTKLEQEGVRSTVATAIR